jgi:hypothetical protein
MYPGNRKTWLAGRVAYPTIGSPSYVAKRCTIGVHVFQAPPDIGIVGRGNLVHARHFLLFSSGRAVFCGAWASHGVPRASFIRLTVLVNGGGGLQPSRSVSSGARYFWMFIGRLEAFRVRWLER